VIFWALRIIDLLGIKIHPYFVIHEQVFLTNMVVATSTAEG
jgi:hypothetical protein